MISDLFQICFYATKYKYCNKDLSYHRAHFLIGNLKKTRMLSLISSHIIHTF